MAMLSGRWWSGAFNYRCGRFCRSWQGAPYSALQIRRGHIGAEEERCRISGQDLSCHSPCFVCKLDPLRTSFVRIPRLHQKPVVRIRFALGTDAFVMQLFLSQSFSKENVKLKFLSPVRAGCRSPLDSLLV
jgi:hypothetical protein